MEISNKNRPVKVGVISLWLLALFIVAFVFYVIGSNQKLFTPKYSLYIFLPNIQGLGPGAFVTLSGLKVGVVGEITFTEKDQQPGIQIELKINREYKKLVTQSTRATIRTLGILGDKYVDLSIGSPAEPPIEAGSFLESNQPLDTEVLLNQATSTLDDFNQTLNNLQEITREILEGKGTLGQLLRDEKSGKNLADLFANLQKISADLAAGQGTAGKLIHDPQLYTSLKRSANNLAIISDRLRKGEGTLGKMLADTTLYVQLNSLSNQTDSLVRKIQGDGTLGKLIKDDSFHQRLVNLTQSLDSLITDIKQNPKKYVTIKVF